MGDRSNYNELSRYSCMLNDQLNFEIRELTLLLFLEKHRILLSFDKKASKFGKLLENGQRRIKRRSIVYWR